ncbi:MAG: folate family ECF transporter S component, partial [Oscillospiraceae bacterium]
MKPIGTLEKQNIFKKSLKELSNPLTLAICGLLIALTVAFNLLTIQVTQSIFISFEFLPYAIVGYLFGPVPSMLFGLLCDVLGYFTNPMGAYFPGFTLIAIIHGFLWGCLIYNKRLEIIRISISKVVIQVVINIFLNTLCVSMLYGLNFYILLGPRIIKNILLLPV